ncbi:MAG: hypothetical protein L5656_03065 [Thermanaeromonas sp.]|uniref:hypothetical protein n=1 Tax=Thermanaeromonas sp. TaxID=2003697 RepID=UPI0024395DD7|nr:hypothetical protein [Thermanaeromonas sp.]MCG0277499.1 hypothetical protein [Thermanaeromonas sp.]
MKSSYRRFLLVLAGLIIVGVFTLWGPAGLRIAKETLQDTPWQVPVWALPQFLRPEPRIEKLYQACGHREEIPLPEEVNLRWIGKKELEILFPPQEGWEIYPEQNGRLVITQKVPGLCPQDAPKRHLAELDGRVAVYRGPTGSMGDLERVLDIRMETLPREWQERIRQGRAEFRSEEELLKALDSLEEYSADAW